MDKLLTPQEVADLLGGHRSTTYQWTHQGYVPHVKLGNLVWFKLKTVSDWLDTRERPGRNKRGGRVV